MRTFVKLLLCTSSLLSASSLYAASANGATTVSIVDCLNVTAAPKQLIIACGDGNRYIAGIHWTQWGLPSAKGSGQLTWNDCSPTCAAGHYHSKPITFSATKIVTYRGHKVYSELVGPKGSWTTSSATWDLLPE